MLVGPILKNASSFIQNRNASQSRLFEDQVQVQAELLEKILSKAKKTEFGKHYGIEDVLRSPTQMQTYKQHVPIFQYDYMFKKWWHKTLSGMEDVTWPGRIENFALTSGTTNSSSKKIPVSKQMIKAIKKTAISQVSSLSNLTLPASFFEKDVLCVGGSTDLNKINNQYEGDLSGILTGKVPHWLNPFTKPGKKVRAISNWDEKLEKMIELAPKWDVGIICGVPAWVQILIKGILERYQLKSIYEIWPNLRIYIHGGVAFKPYLQSFNALFKDQVIYLDSYLASEGFLGFQEATSTHMKLNINHGIYFEFVPFDLNHFDGEGNLKQFSDALHLGEVDENTEYAVLITTVSGAFRYLIGDTIKFTNLADLSFTITGRTKHFLSFCGEHLSVDNMNEAISQLSYEKWIKIDEFAVVGSQLPNGNFKHKWYIASNDPINKYNFKFDLDNKLCQLNDDYKTERGHALEEIQLEILPPHIFYDFLKLIDKYGSQHKFPRVLKGSLASDWERYIQIMEEENAKLMVGWQSGSWM